ncbi:MAG: response regulator [Cyanobacteria bacterium P01_F01_bin.53]
MSCQSIIQVVTNTFDVNKQSQFTGVVNIAANGVNQWSINFHLGRMVWAETAIHPVRRWYRQVIRHCPQIIPPIAKPKNIAQSLPSADLGYTNLFERVQQGTLNRISMAQAVEDYLSEILFDIIHEGSLRQLHGKTPFTFTAIEHRVTNSFFLSFRARNIWEKTQAEWQAWKIAGLTRCSPNLAPTINDSAALQKHTSAAIYEHLTDIIDGKQTFRDIALRLNQSLVAVTKRILPYIRKGIIGLVKVSDLEIAASRLTHPLNRSRSRSSNTALHNTTLHQRQLSTRTSSTVKQSPLIVYVDDSPMDSQRMGNILQEEGFRYFNIQEATHALPILIEHKPQLIFLDLVMPVANGYEICTQLRRVSQFKNIPIIIVTSNNTITDRVRAKMVGASGFLSKPINKTRMLKMVNKLLK